MTASDARRDAHPESLNGGEAEHRHLGVEMTASLGALLKADMLTRYTQAEKESARSAFDVQAAGPSADERKTLREFSLSAGLLADHVKLLSYRRDSTFSRLGVSGSGVVGRLEQHHLTAVLWQSQRADVSMDAASSRTSVGFMDFGDSPEADLHAKGRRISQYRSNIRFDRFAFSALRRETKDVHEPDGLGGLDQTDAEAKLSLNIADLRTMLGVAPVYRGWLPLPDSIWLGSSRGWVRIDGETETIDKMSIGATRAFGYGAVNLSYWRSQSRSDELMAAAGSWASGDGFDAASDIHYGSFGMSGKLSMVSHPVPATGTETRQDTLQCALFATWRLPLGADLKAGVTTNSVENELFRDSTTNRNGSFRYQLALDISEFASEYLRQNHLQLKLFASFQASQSRSQAELIARSETMFTGLQLSVPLSAS